MATGMHFRKILPKELKRRDMRGKVFNGLRTVQRQAAQMFDRTVETWEHKPEFERSIPSYRDDIGQIAITTDDDIYTLVSEGSPEHVIIPRGDYPLFFHSEYAAKTAPGVIDSVEGGPGPKNRVRDFVDHPGFTGRHFDQQIMQEILPIWRFEMSKAFREAGVASGWSL